MTILSILPTSLPLLASLTTTILTILCALIAIAFYTLSERKFLGYLQYRKGPNKPRILALTIPVADAGKLFSKEEKSTLNRNIKFYIIAPISIIILALILWPIIPSSSPSLFTKFGVAYFLCITRIRVYATFIAGWSSNSKWGILGAIRGVAQTISYEVSLSLIIIRFIIYPTLINTNIILRNQISWIIIPILPIAYAWVISILAETHRAPFDFAEGESELVSGFNIEYRSSFFALIFIAEYINILIISLITILILTRNNSNIELILKTLILAFLFIWARGALPRLRYDILINILWKKILPISLLLLIIIIPIILLIK